MQELRELKNFNDKLPSKEEKTPLLFVGHGSPMNAIEENEFSKQWQKLGNELGKPAAILCISAHWETNGTFVTAMERPKTIHDFYGFPNELFRVEYSAPGSPELAGETKEIISRTDVELDNEWGLDHGTWSVLKHFYPNADVLIVQLSIDHNKPVQWHYELAKEIASLRNKGVLIAGSGNIVHNLRMLDWHNQDNGFDWADIISDKIKSLIKENNHKELINYNMLGREALMAVPTPEHYIPLIYILGLKEKDESISFFNDKIVMGSLSMTSLLIR
jgi:4,5-DOPA dioxygenase extradiol